MSTPQINYRKDYQQPNYFINTTNLTVQLGEEHTLVTAVLTLTRNEENPSENLVLQGADQKLLSVKVNDKTLAESDYQLTDESLTIFNTPAELTLTIETQIEPQNNTTLMGLYKSGGNFCTQCESEGFRKITYYLDRPDVMAIFTTKIIADKEKYPVLLANGNLIESGNLDNGQHFAVWHDPFKKPAYLFAMVGGNLAVLEDHFITCSGRKVDLKIYAADKVIDQCQYAMQALKKSMAWDEEHYGREYDLDIFMIVAVNDFNFGAMENKGLNIFNDKYILVDSQTATDTDYGLIDAVVGHEYFHNWSGNRVTVRDWFQLSLKEGLTVFRDHSFSETIGSAAIERINQVKKLRAAQFPEDAGPLAHPIRPDSYIEMSNFYTATVYEKGSEVIRMMKTILGPENYRKGTDLYFDRNDGKAVTCDDFVQAMQDASGIDLTLFKRWYCQSGTPVVKAETTYDEEEQTLTIVLEQTCPPTPGQESKEPFHIPVEIGLLDSNGKDMTFSLAGDLQGTTCVLNLITAEQPFVLTGVTEKPTVSFLRGFSAPVKLDFNYTDEELAFLMAHDSDAVARWEAGQTLMVNSLFALMEQHQQGESLTMPTLLLNSMQALLAQAEEDDKALIAEMLLLPSEFYLIELMETVDVDALVTARRFLKHAIAENLRDSLLAVYKANPVDEQFEYEVAAVARRSLRNACLNYLMQLEEEGMQKLGFDQFESANNMTDEIAAINLLASSTTNYRSQAMNAFYDKWLDNNLVMDKWFIAQALSKQANTVEHIRELMEDKAFNIKNPNKVRSLLGAFTRNFSEFHSANGEGYKLIAEQTIVIDKLNPMVAARLVTGMAQWKRFNGERAQLMKQQLERILATEGLSKDTYEIVSKSLTA